MHSHLDRWQQWLAGTGAADRQGRRPRAPDTLHGRVLPRLRALLLRHGCARAGRVEGLAAACLIVHLCCVALCPVGAMRPARDVHAWSASSSDHFAEAPLPLTLTPHPQAGDTLLGRATSATPTSFAASRHCDCYWASLRRSTWWQRPCPRTRGRALAWVRCWRTRCGGRWRSGCNSWWTLATGARPRGKGEGALGRLGAAEMK